MINIEEKTSIGEVVSLDDRNFINCKFANCTLYYSGADFALLNTRIENCKVTLSGAAQRTVSLLGMLGLLNAGGGVLAPPPPVQ